LKEEVLYGLKLICWRIINASRLREFTWLETTYRRCSFSFTVLKSWS